MRPHPREIVEKHLHVNDEKNGGHLLDKVIKIDPWRERSCIFSDGATYHRLFMKILVNYFLKAPLRGS